MRDSRAEALAQILVRYSTKVAEGDVCVIQSTTAAEVLVQAGTPVFGTCAGMIMLDRDHLGLADYTCRRNAFGRQIRSFEADLRIPGVAGAPVRAVFIRAPWVAEAGEEVEILASVDGHPVAARQDNMLVIAFHPELAGERRLHELFLRAVRERAEAAA